MPCGHALHSVCLDEWLRVSGRVSRLRCADMFSDGSTLTFPWFAVPDLPATRPRAQRKEESQRLDSRRLCSGALKFPLDLARLLHPLLRLPFVARDPLLRLLFVPCHFYARPFSFLPLLPAALVSVRSCPERLREVCERHCQELRGELHVIGKAECGEVVLV